MAIEALFKEMVKEGEGGAKLLPFKSNTIASKRVIYSYSSVSLHGNSTNLVLIDTGWPYSTF